MALPVAANVGMGLMRSLPSGRIGMDAVALAAILGAMLLGEAATAAVIGLMVVGGEALEARLQADLSPHQREEDRAPLSIAARRSDGTRWRR
jgi:cation transport ATPase